MPTLDDPKINTSTQWLQDSWYSLTSRIGTLGCEDEVLQELIVFYGEPNRHYHTLEHITDCLVTLSGCRQFCPNPDAVALAIWFHDAIFNTRESNNEELSAQYAHDACLRMGLSQDIANKIKNMVLATTHRSMPDDADSRLLVDIDLATLALEPDLFEHNTRKIRLEYDFIDTKTFIAGRNKMFEAMIDRPRIYYTEHFFTNYEDMARANLLAFLLELDQTALK